MPRLTAAATGQAVGLACSSSLDNLSFGIAYALKGVRVGLFCNAIVATINSLGMCAFFPFFFCQ